MEEKKMYLSNGDLLIRTEEGKYFLSYGDDKKSLLIDPEEGERLLFETNEQLKMSLEALIENSNSWQGLTEQYENTMKFFEFHYPYYALIKAKNVVEAVQEYEKSLGDNDDDNLLEDEVKEVSRDYALITYSQGLSEDGKVIPTSEILEDFQNDENMTLLVDSALM